MVNDNAFTVILSTRYSVSTLFLQPGPPCFPHNSPCTHGKYSDVVKCSVEGAMSCRYLPSVARHWTFMLEGSSKQPLSDCIGWTHYSYNQVHPSLQPTQFDQ